MKELETLPVNEITNKLDEAIPVYIEKDLKNLERGIHELNISNNLAFCLKAFFDGYDVDPEYNLDIDKPNDRKALSIARDRILAVGKNPNIKDTYKLSPDIIIHQRETNKFNLVVIEVKKDISDKDEKEYDLIKLEHLTIDYLGNHYNYDLGIAIEFATGQAAGKYDMKFFQNGLPKLRVELT